MGDTISWDLLILLSSEVTGRSPRHLDEARPKRSPMGLLEFDSSGSYLAIAGSDVRVYQVANVKLEWNLIKILPDLSGTGKVSCVKFGADAKNLAVGSMDRNLRIFGLPGDEAEEPKSPDH
ncbi:hypothetical protein BHM03_00042816 [Ensete ventricosum]|nr:hypothetical protein BHM03_00042816 [Ensete ventricosum]